MCDKHLAFNKKTRFDISESKAKAKFVDCDSFGRFALLTLSVVCKMVGGTDIAAHFRLPSVPLHTANGELGHLQLQCESWP